MAIAGSNLVWNVHAAPQDYSLAWQRLPDLPNSDGVAGPFVGTHHDALIIAGGANFPSPVWDHEKVWHDRIYVLIRNDEGYQWHSGHSLPRPLAYGASVSTEDGVVCIGGNDGTAAFADVFLIRWNPTSCELEIEDYPALPYPLAHAAATTVGDTIYLAGGQTDGGLESATSRFWALDLSKRGQTGDGFAWKELAECPGPARAFNLTVGQHNGDAPCVYVISGRRMKGDQPEFLTDAWEFNTKSLRWRRRADIPSCVMAGTAAALGQNHVIVIGGADGSLFAQADQLKDHHPGFPKKAFAFNAQTGEWRLAGPVPANQVTTSAIKWHGGIVIPTGEIRPRVRTPNIWHVNANR